MKIPRIFAFYRKWYHGATSNSLEPMESIPHQPAGKDAAFESLRGRVIETADSLGYHAQFTDEMADTAAQLLSESESSDDAAVKQAVELRLKAAAAERANQKLDGGPGGIVERRT